jgi:predicted enzyme related to lactoylglutathione lyase
VFRVPDLDRARKELAARGVKFDDKIEEIPGMVRIGTFHDPFGNRLQLVQLLMTN